MGLERGPALKRSEGESLALTTTRLYTQRFPWARECQLYVPTESRLLISPRILKVWRFAASGSTYTDLTANTTDRDSATTGSISAILSTAFIYISSNYRFRGFYCNMSSSVNANAATLTIGYWNGTAWGAVAGGSDGTASGGATFAVDGEVSWTLPSDEVTTDVNGVLGAYWIRLSVSATLSASTAIEELILLHQNVNYDYIQGGLHTFNCDQVGGFVALVDAGTATGRVNWHGFSGD